MKRSARGMTLVELMVALAVLGLLAGLSVAGYQAMLEQQKQSAAPRDVLNQAQEAQKQARTVRQPVRLVSWTEVRSGRPVQLIRWEQLGCEDPTDTWGGTCPSAACTTNRCGLGACECTASGLELEVPTQLDLTAINGLCWLGEGARPVKRAGTTYCDGTSADGVVSDGDLAIKYASTVKQVMTVAPLTGAPRLVDCERYPADPACVAAATP